MAMLKFCFYLLVMLIFIVLGLVFSFRNQSLVNVDLLLYEFPPLSVGIWILSSLIIGVILGASLAYPKNILQNIRIKRLAKKASKNNSLPAQIKIEPNKGH